MDLGDRLIDSSYIPEEASGLPSYKPTNFYFEKVIKCPVKFTKDPFEYISYLDGYRLKPIQEMVVRDLFEEDAAGIALHDEAVFISGMRCLGLGTEVLMYDGSLKKIEDIAVGELVMGPDSTPRKVLYVSKGKSELYEVKQSCAMTYIVNESHILSLKKARSVECEIGNRGQKNARFNNYPDIVNIPIKEYLKKSNKWKYFFRGYTAGCLEFQEQPIPIDPYLLGLYLGDSRQKYLEIVSNDKEIEKWLFEFCEKIGYRLSFSSKNGTSAKAYRLCNDMRDEKGYPINILWEEFKKLKLDCGKHIPQCYISNSKEIRLKVLAAMLDTDGYLHQHGYEITLANEKLACDVKRLADTLGFRTYIRKKVTSCKNIKTNYNFKGVAWRLSIHGNVWEIPCLVKRKQYVHNGKHTNKENNLSSLKVQSIGVGKYAGFTVDKDHLFCLSDCTVTNNSGKSVAGGVIGSFLLHKLLAMDNPAQQLGQLPSQTFTGEYIATSEQQSKRTAYATFENIVTKSSWWVKYLAYLQEREDSSRAGRESLFIQHQRRIAFPEKNIEVLSLHSNSGSIAGMTAFFVCFDEMSRFDISEGDIQQKSEKRTAQAVYFTASRAAKTLRNFSKVLTITSPMYETDFGMQLLYMAETFKAGTSKNVIDALRSRYSRRIAGLLGYHYSTFEANPKTKEDPTGYTAADFEKEKNSNYAAYMRDYLAIPPAAISPFFELPERIDQSVNHHMSPLVHFKDEIDVLTVGSETRNYISKKISILNSNKMQKYFICCDQGAVKDSFAVSMGHGENITVKVPDARGDFKETVRYKVVIDFVEAWVPDKEKRITVSFQNVEEVISVLNSCFYIDRVVFDAWHSTESIERLFSKGVMTKKLSATLEMYETLKILIYSGMVELPPSDKLLTELRQLNVIKSARVEHPSEGSKDLADSICRTVWCIYLDGIKDSIHGKIMLPGGQSFPTLRSVADKYELFKNDMFSGTPNYGIFSKASGGGRGVFGKSMIVETNVVPTIGDVKLR